MRILIANLELNVPYGSENYSWTIAEEFERRGHDVEMHSNRSGYFARQVKVPIVSQPVGEYDIAIVSHARILKHRDKIKAKHTFLICHGPEIANETPIKSWNGKHTHVAVSEEVSKRRASQIDGEFLVIPNPVAPEFFEVGKSERPAVFYANHRHAIPPGLWEACGNNKLSLVTLSKGEDGYFTRVTGLNILNSINIVIGTGRWIYEAMAAGKHCLISDSKKTKGWVSPENFDWFQGFNMTCRGNRVRPVTDWNTLLRDANGGESLRAVALEKLHVGIIADRFIEIYNEQNS